MKTQDLITSTLAFCALASAAATPVERKLPSNQGSKHLRPYLERRDEPGYADGQPIDGKGKGAPISGVYYEVKLATVAYGSTGGTNKQIDIDNPANLGQESTDNGAVKNLKWRFSDSKTRQLPGGWVREQVITDLPASKDISGAQQHLTKGSIRELHWHRVVSTLWR